jgi:glutamate synthase domain-containing protein 3
MVDLVPVLAEGEQDAKVARELWHQGVADEALLRRLIERHVRYTGSVHGRAILDDWAAYRTRFVKVFPKEYRRALTEWAARNKRIAA